MWIYDGEEWTEEGASETKPRETQPPTEQFYPELQVVEIVPVPVPNYVPQMPQTSRRGH